MSIQIVVEGSGFHCFTLIQVRSAKAGAEQSSNAAAASARLIALKAPGGCSQLVQWHFVTCKIFG
jgi:hypothetical protein